MPPTPQMMMMLALINIATSKIARVNWVPEGTM